MQKNSKTTIIPLAIPEYTVSLRKKETRRTDGTVDTVCVGRLQKCGKPVAVAPKQRTAHYTEDIPIACRQIAGAFEMELRKAATKDDTQQRKCSSTDDNCPLLEGVRRIRESEVEINPKNGNKGWIARTQNSFLAIFSSQVAPLLVPYASGEKEFLPSDLDDIVEKMQKKKGKNAHSNGRIADLTASTYADLAAADIIYQFMRNTFRDLELPAISLTPPNRRRTGARREQQKSLPESVRQELCRYVDAHWQQEPRFCYGLTLMLCGGLRTAEAAGTRPEGIEEEYEKCYGVVKVHAQEKDGKIDRKLKREDSYRGVVIGTWACTILRRCVAEICKTAPDWENDENAPVCKAQDLSAWVYSRLCECGLSEAYMAAARKNYEEDVACAADGQPIEDFTAYILRRDWASRARNICGYTSIEIDQQLGHRVTIPKSKRPNLKTAAEQKKLAGKAERYVYCPKITMNPRYRAVALEVGACEVIPTYGAVGYRNNSDSPMLVTLSFDAQENAEAVRITAPSGGIRKAISTSRRDDADQRQNRPIIGQQTKED